jgi:hypothetical protein
VIQESSPNLAMLEEAFDDAPKRLDRNRERRSPTESGGREGEGPSVRREEQASGEAGKRRASVST